MEIKVGDFYIRHSDGQISRVKWTDRSTVVLESEDGSRLLLADIFALERTYSKRASKPIQKSH